MFSPEGHAGKDGDCQYDYHLTDDSRSEYYITSKVPRPVDLGIEVDSSMFWPGLDLRIFNY